MFDSIIFTFIILSQFSSPFLPPESLIAFWCSCLPQYVTCMRENIYCLSLWAWLILLNMMTSSAKRFFWKANKPRHHNFILTSSYMLCKCILSQLSLCLSWLRVWLTESSFLNKNERIPVFPWSKIYSVMLGVDIWLCGEGSEKLSWARTCTESVESIVNRSPWPHFW